MPIRRYNFVLVEDDAFQAQWVRDELEREFDADIWILTSESEYYQQESAIAATPPDILILDVMLPYLNPNELTAESWAAAAEAPPEETKQAGIRISERIAMHPTLKRTPLILFTVLDREDLPEGTFFIPKQESIRRLASEIRRRLKI